jgi:hypothetical protein
LAIALGQFQLGKEELLDDVLQFEKRLESCGVTMPATWKLENNSPSGQTQLGKRLVNAWLLRHSETDHESGCVSHTGILIGGHTVNTPKGTASTTPVPPLPIAKELEQCRQLH